MRKKTEGLHIAYQNAKSSPIRFDYKKGHTVFSIAEITAFADLIKSNLISLTLSGVGLTDEGLKIICSALQRELPSDGNNISLNFSNNNLTDNSVEMLTSLGFYIKNLDLENNNFSDKAIKFAEPLSLNKIGSIDLKDNSINNRVFVKKRKDSLQDTEYIKYLNNQSSTTHLTGESFDNNEDG